MAAAANSSWSELSLRAAAAHLRDGDITAEVYAQALLAVCAANRSLNAFISLDRDRVLSEARTADLVRMRGHLLGPLHGVPLAIKDVFDVAGSPTTAGTPALRDYVPRHTAPRQTVAQPRSAAVMTSKVRFGSEVDICAAIDRVRSTPDSGHQVEREGNGT